HLHILYTSDSTDGDRYSAGGRPGGAPSWGFVKAGSDSGGLSRLLTEPDSYLSFASLLFIRLGRAPAPLIESTAHLIHLEWATMQRPPNAISNPWLMK
ncbi:hypothetical protein, partial [Collinsella tanakaei]|uniref:hypothetical protein n=1 Tax=Collinsella tanakaei TaxID=626935 RepID=UPI001955FA88